MLTRFTLQFTQQSNQHLAHLAKYQWIGFLGTSYPETMGFYHGLSSKMGGSCNCSFNVAKTMPYINHPQFHHKWYMLGMVTIPHGWYARLTLRGTALATQRPTTASSDQRPQMEWASRPNDGIYRDKKVPSGNGKIEDQWRF
jgi:hypothetical protein